MRGRLRKSFTKPSDAHHSPDLSRLTQEIVSARMALENISSLLEAVSPHDGGRRRSGRNYLILASVWAIL
jgi:hypothetical protein